MATCLVTGGSGFLGSYTKSAGFVQGTALLASTAKKVLLVPSGTVPSLYFDFPA